jgi:hypothetical protein
MAWSKRDLVNEAYAELALAGYEFDLDPDELQFGLRRLDLLMASWMALSINLGYAFGTSPDDSDLDQDSGLPLYATMAACLALAINIAAGKGKAVPSTTRTGAKSAYDAMVSKLASDQAQQSPLRSGTPRGAGAKSWRTFNQPFAAQPDTSPLQVGDDGGLIFNDTGA